MSTMAAAAMLALRPAVRIRPVYLKDLGQLFTKLRHDRGWSQSEAASIAERRQLPNLTRQVLLRLENGQTKNPDPEALQSLSRLYDVPYEQLVRALVESVERRYAEDAAQLNNKTDKHGLNGVGTIVP